MVKLEFGSIGFWGEGKPECLEKNLLEQRRESTTTSTQIWHQRWDLNPGHIGGRQVLSPLLHPCSPRWPLVHVQLYTHVTPGALNIASWVDYTRVGFLLSKSFFFKVESVQASQVPLSLVLLSIYTLASELLFDHSQVLDQWKNMGYFAVYT